MAQKKMKDNLNDCLKAAIEIGDIEQCRNLINNYNNNLDFLNTSVGFDFLCLAIGRNHKEIAKLLILNGCKVKLDNRSQNNVVITTPLHFAVCKQDIEIVDMLLSRGALIDVLSSYGETPFTLAIEHKDEKIANLLIKKGASLSNYHNGLTMLHIVAVGGYLELVKILINRGADLESKAFLAPYEGITPLLLVILEITEPVAECLRSSLCTRNDLCHNGLCWPRNGDCRHIQVIKYFIKQGACINVASFRGCYTPLHVAACSGNVKLVKLFLDHNADVNCASKNGETPLHIAAKKEHKEVAELLVNSGANIHATDEKGMTPFDIVVSAGCVSIAELFLKLGANINLRSVGSHQEFVFTPLQYAVKEGNIQLVKLFLDYGGDINILAEGNNSLLHLAAENGDGVIISLLLAEWNDVNLKNDLNETPLHVAAQFHYSSLQTFCHQSNVNVINKNSPLVLLLENGADIDAQDIQGNTVLCTAVRLGNIPLIKYFLSYGPSTNNRGNRNSLKIAGFNKTTIFKEIIEILLEYGFTIDLNDKNLHEFMYACVAGGHVNLIEELVKYGANFNPTYHEISKNGHPFMFLHYAIALKQEKIVKIFLNINVDVNLKDRNGDPPIFYAFMNNDINIIKLLLNNGALLDIKLLHKAIEWNCVEAVRFILRYYSRSDINSVGYDGRTALHFTCVYDTIEKQYDYLNCLDHKIVERGIFDDDGRSEIAKMLLMKGAIVNVKTKDQLTPLHLACKSGLSRVVKILLECNADVNCIDICGSTPLHCSAKLGHICITEMLLKKGANVNVAQTSDGMTALHVATLSNQTETARTLLRSGAKFQLKDRFHRTSFNIGEEKCLLQISKLLLCYDNSTDDLKRNFSDYTTFFGTTRNDGTLTFVILSLNWSPTEGPHLPPVVQDCYNHNTYSFRAVIIEEHLNKLRCLELSKFLSVEKLLRESKLFDDIKQPCVLSYRSEIIRLTDNKIYGKVSLYDILTKRLRDMCVYMKNEKFLKLLNSNDYDSLFPIYGDLLYNQFVKGRERNTLLEQCNNILYSHDNLFSTLPINCIEQIFGNLTNKELQTFVDYFSYCTS